MPLILTKTSSSDHQIQWKSAAFSQYPRMESDGDFVMGYSMRTDRYRYTEWPRYDSNSYRPIWSEHRLAVELYDHLFDPDENRNVAYDAQYSDDRKRLSTQLRAGWRAALPLSPLNCSYFLNLQCDVVFLTPSN
jgi:iduronate 2-sulfatase